MLFVNVSRGLNFSIICVNCLTFKTILCFCCRKPSVLDAFWFWVCPSVNESVCPKNFVKTISQKPLKGISLNFVHRYISVHRCSD